MARQSTWPGIGVRRHRDPGGDSTPADPDTEARLVLRYAYSRDDQIFRALLRVGGLGVLAIAILILVFLAVQSSGALSRAGWGFLTTKIWNPAQNRFGIAALLPDGALIAAIALIIAVPVALGAALYISEFAPVWLRRPLITLVDLMAAVPSIVYALWGLFFLMPNILPTIRWISEHLGFIPIFAVGGPHSPSAFATSTFIAGLVVSLMVIPIIASISRQVYSQAPQAEREAAYALGSTRLGMIRSVVLPYGRGGAIGAILLGFGRAMGETIAVSLIISPTDEIVTHIFENSGNSISAKIALRYLEYGPVDLTTLFAAGLALYVITMAVNTVGSIIINRSRSGLQTTD
jgi:phosphate transport system permease protein